MIRLRVPGSLTYRHLALRVVSAACRMTAPGGEGEGDVSGEGERRLTAPFDADLGGDLGDAPMPASGSSDDGDDEVLTEAEFEAQTLSAFGEAFNNVAIHGYRSGPLGDVGDVDIEIEADEGGITIRLLDSGASFDPTAVAVPDMTALPESGMGLFIIHSFMDEVDYSPGSPNVLRLVKRRDPRGRGAGDGDEDARGEARAPVGAARAAGAA